MPNPRRSSAQLAISAALLATTAAAQTATIIGLPDTQNYSEFYPQIFNAQTQWIAQNAQALGIRYVSHYGDVVNHGDRIAEWNNANAAMAILDATDIPYGVTAGNHDITPSGSAGSAYIPQNFRSYFGPSRFAGRDWYRGHSPSEMSSYQVFDAHGVQFLALHIECDGALRELEWAQGILDENRDKPVFMTTHRYLQDAQDYTSGVPLVPSGRYPEIWYGIEGVYATGGIRSEEIWDWFIRRNPNILLVQCGHFHEEYRQTSVNAYGLPVHEVLADYQDDPNGGDGWLRIMTLDLGNKRIGVQSYSPTLNAFRTASESAFSLACNFSAYRSQEPVVVLQQGINGYQGTQDTWINQDQPNTSYGGSGILVSDDDTTNSIFNDRRGHALVRFDGLVGPAGVGRIPQGAQILSATLTIQVTDDIDAPSQPDFFLHQVFVPWSEGSTWNSLGNGLDGGDIGPAIARIDGDNVPNTDGMRRIDVTAVVQAWANGASNNGFAILPEIVSLKDDGIEIQSSESSNPLLRPRLEITYASDCGYSAYGENLGGANTTQLVGLGFPSVGGTIEVTSLNVASNLAVTAASLASTSAPLLGGFLLIDPALIIDVQFGKAHRVLPVPDSPVFADLELFLQSAVLDATQPSGLALSNGVRAKVCR
jgi:hypothetical protein